MKKHCKNINVLIYPYWNVNNSSALLLDTTGAVLIYPYWNVNATPVATCIQHVAVLIYPYWNVNMRMTMVVKSACLF